jgi:hypothetical protein
MDRQKFLKLYSFKTVFSNLVYVILAASVAAAFWIIFNFLDQLIFFYPIWIFYLPEDAIAGFILTNITSILLGILVSMNLYLLKHSKLRVGKSLFSGTVLSVISSACASCSSVGFLIISTFGAIGVLATNILTNYQTPLRLISIGILLFALYTLTNRISKSCIVGDYGNAAQLGR